jgi:hypothetical protein
VKPYESPSATKKGVNPGPQKAETNDKQPTINPISQFRGPDLGTNGRQLTTAHQKPGVLFPGTKGWE